MSVDGKVKNVFRQFSKTHSYGIIGFDICIFGNYFIFSRSRKHDPQPPIKNILRRCLDIKIEVINHELLEHPVGHLRAKKAPFFGPHDRENPLKLSFLSISNFISLIEFYINQFDCMIHSIKDKI